MNDAQRRSQQQRGRGGGVMETPVAVKVPQAGLLDVKVDTHRSNPSCFTTCFSAFLTAALLALCFVLVGVPPLHIQDDGGKRIYVGVMIPLLTVINTVLIYYTLQHQQRMLNSAVMRIVEETEQHAVYLGVAINNVEAELQALGADSYMEAVDDFAHPWGMTTPKDSGLQRTPVASASACVDTAVSAALSALEGLRFLRGIRRLEEYQDMTIATVHVGKEWQWLMGLLGRLNVIQVGGSASSVMQYQRVAVGAVAMSVTRVERMILTLYFSSFLLQRVKAVATVQRNHLAFHTGATRAGAPCHNRRGRIRYQSDSPDATSTLHTSVLTFPSKKMSFLPKAGHERETSLESIFTPPRETPRELADGVDEGCTDGEITSRLTPGSGKAFCFEDGVGLLEFAPLQNIEVEGRIVIKPEDVYPAPPLTTPAADVAPANPVEEASHADPEAQSRADKDLRKAKERFFFPFARGLDTRTSAEMNKGKDKGHQVDCKGGGMEPAVSSSPYGSLDTVAPSGANSVVWGPRRRPIAVSGTVAGKKSDISTASGHQSTWSETASPDSRNGRSCGNKAHFTSPHAGGGSTSVLPITKPLSERRLIGRRRLGRPACALIHPPSLSIDRGARFVGDGDDVFLTVRFHRRTPDATDSSHLYAAVAHVAYDASSGRQCFSNEPDASLGIFFTSDPFTICEVSNHEEGCEGLRAPEKGLLQLVYCRPEVQTEADPSKSTRVTDLSSLMVRRGGDDDLGYSPSAAADMKPSAPGGRSGGPLNGSSVSAAAPQCVDSLIVAMKILEDRPMRLAFLPVTTKSLRQQGAHLTHTRATPHLPVRASHSRWLISSKELHRASGGDVFRSEDGVTISSSETDAQAAVTKTVPVLECVIDDMFCILTHMEVTMNALCDQPRRLILIGVSLEDVSEEGSERGDMDESSDSAQDTTVSSNGSARRDGVNTTTHPTGCYSPPHGEARNTMVRAPETRGGVANIVGENPMLLRTLPGQGSFPSSHTASRRCSFGQEFREVIYFE